MTFPEEPRNPEGANHTQQTVYHVANPPQQASSGKRFGPGAMIATALVASLIAGGGAGYVAGSRGAEQSGETYNALEAQPAESANEPEGEKTQAPKGSVEDVAAQVLPAVVSIMVQTPRGGSEGSGSIISSDGYVLTNHHVIADAQSPQARIQVTLNDGTRHDATYVASDVNTDVGVLKIENVSNLPTMKFGNSDQLAVGQEVVAVGSPLGLSATVTSGIVSALNRPVRANQGGGESSLMDGIQTDAAINPGNSGGPLVDMQGNLIGMNSVIASLSAGSFGGQQGGSIGLGFAIPSNFAKRVAQQLIDDGVATQPMLGVRVNALDDGTEGARVAAVEPGSPAEQAGLHAGDVIVKLGDRLIDSADSLIAATRSHDFGETVTLQVERPGEEDPVSVDVALSSE
ncbi:trypsin-like peptidase domain-containing protein [Corynebacterium sp. HMSC074A01]|uniref:S1C family serine protease n=1 Tax=Corynebacterium sp. HMSC074A01 TaxID=1715030 RepID=UPI0009F50168